MKVEFVFVGMMVFIFGLALANATPDIFSLSDSVESLIRIGFLFMSMFGLIIGGIKGLSG